VHTRARRQAASIKTKEVFGAGSGRSAGFYRQYAKVADPATASEEAATAQKAHCYMAETMWHTGFGQVALRNAWLMLTCLRLCPKLRPAANTNQLGLRWPATPALYSAQARRQVERERAARRAHTIPKR